MQDNVSTVGKLTATAVNGKFMVDDGRLIVDYGSLMSTVMIWISELKANYSSLSMLLPKASNSRWCIYYRASCMVAGGNFVTKDSGTSSAFRHQ